MPLSILNILITGAALHLLADGRLEALTRRPNHLYKMIEGANPAMIGVLWIGSFLILYAAACGLDNLNRPGAKPRNYKYAE
jgi:hypothetical protein